MACTNKESNETVLCSGFEFDSDDVQMIDPFTLDSIQYSNGSSKFLLSGSIWISGKKSSLSLLLDSDFRNNESFKILNYSMPFNSEEEVFECVLTFSGSTCELSWRSQKQLFYLRNTFIVRC